jgi:UPF0755 protein
MPRGEDTRPEQGRPVRPATRRRAMPAAPPDVSSRDRATVRHLSAEETVRKRRTLGLVVVIVGVVLALGIPAYGVWNILIRPQVSVAAGSPVHIVVSEGSDTQSIAEMLASKGVVDNAAMFRLRARIDKVDGKLRPGEYDLMTGMSYGAVVDRLLAGPSVESVPVTIPEGFTVVQIAERLEKATGISAGEFTDIAMKQSASFAPGHPELKAEPTGSLEGYLFPKTYRIPEGASAREVIDMMLSQFDEEIAEVDLAYASGNNLDLHDVVTIASMIEREARIAKERPVVSSVIYNRLKKNMRLEIDATIEYILPGTRPRLLNKHLKIDSPYNTYMYGGLPPGPIASPGLASLEAAAHPADTEYLYYVLTSKDGSHTFTKTLEEFLIAKEKSREVVP